MYQKKVIRKNVTEICHFSLLLMFVKLVLLINFYRGILRFLISFLIFFKKIIFWVILVLFKNFEANRAKNGSKNQTTYFVMCLRFQFCTHQRV